MLAIIDYGRGNLFSLQSALKYLGSNFKIVANAEELNSSYDKIILPGVGAFGDAIAQLKYKNFISKLNNAYERKVPILGICLGMQLFASRSFEFLTTEGFNFIPGEVKKLKLDKPYNIPNIGWRILKNKKENRILKDNFNNKMTYFVHSFGFFPENQKHILSVITIGSQNIPAIVRNKNAIGFQFHPEKSGKEGLGMLNWFINEFS